MVQIDGSFTCRGCNTLFIAPKEVNRNWQQYTIIYKRNIKRSEINVVVSESETRPLTPEEWITIKDQHKAEVTALHTSHVTDHPHNTFTIKTLLDDESELHLELHVVEREAVIGTRLLDTADLLYVKSLRLMCPQCNAVAYIVRDAYAPNPPIVDPLTPPTENENTETEEESE